MSSSSSSSMMVLNIYCILSALFFATCAYAQLNDPNPTLWVMAYLGAGTIPNLLLTSCPMSSIPISVTKALQHYLQGMTILLSGCIIWKLVTVLPKLEHDVDNHEGWMWHFLEHEEGRDSCGLLLLVIHVSYLKTAYLNPTTYANASTAHMNNPLSSSLSNDVFLSSILAVVASPVVQSIALIGILLTAVYMWVVHHPNIVARYGVPHCQGGMFGRDGIAGEL
jgi:hypothetical protein